MIDNNNLLIIGGGGREHALGVALRKSNQVGRLDFAPGNGGTARLLNAQNIPTLAVENIEGIVRYAVEQRPILTVVGPEVPLALGLADRLREAGLVVFGTGADGAQLEASKSWAKTFMERYNIPTAAQHTFTDGELDAALEYLTGKAGPYVVKADGLAAGKGVLVTKERGEAQAFVREALGGTLFGAAGRRVLIEEFMTGPEVSVLALCDTVSGRIIPLEPACDYKRAYDNDEGPNTGGMGAYSPPGFMTPALRDQIQREILDPTLKGLQTEGIDYRGIVYAGLMITPDGPRVVEYNCRFGDPETQSLLPRINNDVFEMLYQTAMGDLASLPPIEWKQGVSVGVVLAAPGYPGAYPKGLLVAGTETFVELDNIFLFHAGTDLNTNGQVITNGGRVFNLVALGDNFGSARERVYNILEKKQIEFEGMHYRRDIAARELK